MLKVAVLESEPNTDYTQHNSYNINQLDIHLAALLLVTAHYSRVNTYKNIVIPEVFYRGSMLNIDSC